MNAAKKAPKKHIRPIYLKVVRACVIDPDTGEMGEPIGALAPLTRWDAETLRGKKLGIGMHIRAELKKPRNAKFDRLAHALGKIAVEQIEKDLNGNDFPRDAHDALKLLQRESGVCCETMDVDLGQFGVVKVNVAQSLAHDSMAADDFDAFFKGICHHLSSKYWPSMHADDIARQAELMHGSDP